MKAVTAYIDTQALINNVRVIRKKVPNSKVIAVVKANAYGHGLYPILSLKRQMPLRYLELGRL